MNVAARWTCLALVLAGCSKPADPPPAANPPARATAAAPREILVDLARWDAATTTDRRAAAEDVARRVPDFALLRLETFSCGGQTHEVAIYRHAKTEMEFVLVPGGTFLMGSPVEDELRHAVILTKSFLLCRTECTQAAYGKVIGANLAHVEGPTLPVDKVSWIDSRVFCGKSGLELPSEAQWEYACRAGTTTAYCFGDAEASLGDYGWYPENSGLQMHPVAQKRPNAFGLYDVHGNAWEWCADIQGDYPAGSVTDPTGASSSSIRIVRGGSCDNPAKVGRSAYRGGLDVDERAFFAGFRPSKTVPMD